MEEQHAKGLRYKMGLACQEWVHRRVCVPGSGSDTRVFMAGFSASALLAFWARPFLAGEDRPLPHRMCSRSSGLYPHDKVPWL